jgi:hypothetical protein
MNHMFLFLEIIFAIKKVCKWSKLSIKKLTISQWNTSHTYTYDPIIWLLIIRKLKCHSICLSVFHKIGKFSNIYLKNIKQFLKKNLKYLSCFYVCLDWYFFFLFTDISHKIFYLFSFFLSFWISHNNKNKKLSKRA